MRISRGLAAIALLASPVAALAQQPDAPSPAMPRFELGAGGSVVADRGAVPSTRFMFDARVGVRLSQSWSLEGLVHSTPADQGNLHGFYRAQARWRIGLRRVRPFVAFGLAGAFSRNSWPESRWTDSSGQTHVSLAGSQFLMNPPWYPTASVGIDRILASRLALRGELTTMIGGNTYGVVLALAPAVSLSIPIGRYPVVSP